MNSVFKRDESKTPASDPNLSEDDEARLARAREGHDAIAQMQSEIYSLRRDNARLRAKSAEAAARHHQDQEEIERLRLARDHYYAYCTRLQTVLTQVHLVTDTAKQEVDAQLPPQPAPTTEDIAEVLTLRDEDKITPNKRKDT